MSDRKQEVEPGLSEPPNALGNVVIQNHDKWSIYQEKSAQVGDGFVRWVEDDTMAYVTDVQAGGRQRGTKLLEWLKKTTGKSLYAVGVVEDAEEFWDKMEERDLIEGQSDVPFMEFFGRGLRFSTIAIKPSPADQKTAPASDIRFSVRSNDLPDAIIAHPIGAASAHKYFVAAKSGDLEAAVRLAEDLVTGELVDRVRTNLGGAKPKLVPVVSIEATGRNRIPHAVALVLADRLGLDLVDNIVQANSPKRTASDGIDRLFNAPEFDGQVSAGESYLLLDDTITQGGTFAGLAGHLRAGGGHVSGAIALTGKQYSAIIKPSQQTLQKLREQFNDIEPDFRRAAGYGFDSLTESEARYIANFKPASTIRDRIVAAGSQREHDQNAGSAEASQVASRGAASKVVGADGLPLEVYHGTRGEFTEFSPATISGQSSNEFGSGFYFTPSRSGAELYAGKDGKVVCAHLDLHNPKIVSTLDRGGATGWHGEHDGLIVVYPDSVDKNDPANWAEIVVAQPSQIKILQVTDLAPSQAATQEQLSRAAEQALCIAYAEPYGDVGPESMKDDFKAACEALEWRVGTVHRDGFAALSVQPGEQLQGLDPELSDLSRPVIFSVGNVQVGEEPWQIWDGVHRMFSAYAKGVDRLPAVMGTKPEAPLPSWIELDPSPTIVDRIKMEIEAEKSKSMTMASALERQRPTFVYHGTSVEQWALNKVGVDLFVTEDRDTAFSYANEWRQQDNTPLVLQFDLALLHGLNLRLIANSENIEQYANGNWGPITKPPNDLTWSDTLAMSGTFAIEGFAQEHKSVAVVVANSNPHGPDTTPEGNDEFSSANPDIRFSVVAESPVADHSVQTPEFAQWFGTSKVVDDGGEPLVVYHGTNADFTSFDKSTIGKTYGIDEEGFFFAGRAEAAGAAADDAAGVGEYHKPYEGFGGGREGHDPYANYDDDEAYDYVGEMSKNNLGQHIMPVYLSMQNPLIINAERGRAAGDHLENVVGNHNAVRMAKEGGHDGIIVNGDYLDFEARNRILYRLSDGGYRNPSQSEEDAALKLVIAREDSVRKLDKYYVVFEPNQIKSATGNSGAFNPKNPDIRFSQVLVEPLPLEAVTTPAFAEVGNQGGRSADDSTPGGTHPFNGFTREQFLGNPKITSDANAKDLVPSTWKSLESEKNVPFAIGSGLTARYSELSAAVYNEKGDVVASYSSGDTLVVDRKYRRQGIGSELVYQWRMRNPNSKTAATRTKKSQSLQEKVWSRIRSERALYESRINQDSNESTAPDSGGAPVAETDTPEFRNWFGNSRVIDDEGKPLVMYHGSYRDVTTFDRLISTQWRQRSMDTVGSWFSDNPSDDGGAGMYASGENAVIYPVYLSISNPKYYATFSEFLDAIHLAEGRDPATVKVRGLGSTEGLRAKLKAEGHDGIVFGRTYNQALLDKVTELQRKVADAKTAEFAVKRAERPPLTLLRENLERSLATLRTRAKDVTSTEFDKQRVYIAFDPEQIKSAIGNVGTFDRANIDIRFSQVEAVMRDPVATKEFSAWFNQSKVVNAAGAPLRVFHGTHADFSAFDFDKASDGAHWFTPMESHAASFGPSHDFYISMQNPMVIDQDDLDAAWDAQHPDGEQGERSLLPRHFVEQFVLQAKAGGYDGLIIREMGDRDIQSDMYLPFAAGQIKSASDNNGNFDASNPDIRFSAAPATSVYERNPAFKNWFESSKVIDAEGNPLKVYHGSPSTFNAFDTYSSMDGGFYFTPDRRVGESFSKDEDGVPVTLHEVYLSLQNPITVDLKGEQQPSQEEMQRIFDKAKSEGYDGAILHGVSEFNGSGTQYVAFSPTQIKSAIDNVGTYDPNTPDIRHSAMNPPTPANRAQSALRQGAVAAKVVAAEGDSPEEKLGLAGAAAVRDAIVAKFPSLASSVDRMLQRGKEGKRGGLVVVGSDDPFDLALSYAKHTGCDFDVAREAFGISASAAPKRGGVQVGPPFFDGQTAFVDLAQVASKLGPRAAMEALQEFSEAIEDSSTWTIRYAKKFDDVADAVAAGVPLDDLYFDPQHMVDSPHWVQRIEAAGFSVPRQTEPSEHIDSMWGVRAGVVKLQGFSASAAGLTFIVAPNVSRRSAPAVVLHEVVHSQQRDDLDTKAQALLDSRTTQQTSTREFLNRVQKRIEEAGQVGTKTEVMPYIVEQSVKEGRQEGFSRADGRFLGWIDKAIGPKVANLVRDFVALVGATALQYDLIEIPTVDELVALAKMGVVANAAGKTMRGVGVRASELVESDVQATGFFSALARGVSSIKARAMKAPMWLDSVRGLVKKGAVKQDEVEWTGLAEWLDLQSGQVSQQEITNYLRTNGAQVDWADLTEWLESRSGKVNHQEITDYLTSNGVPVASADLAKWFEANSGKVSHQEITNYLRSNGVGVKETVLGGVDGLRKTIEAGGYFVGTNDDDSLAVFDGDNVQVDHRDLPDAVRTAAEQLSRASVTRYGAYQIPGGENYREVLLTLPSATKNKVIKSPDGEWRVMDSAGVVHTQRYPSESDALEAAPGVAAAYRSSHWNQPNVLAHVRLNDRTDTDGRRVLFVEEIQSDWGQLGKKKGFVSNEKLPDGWSVHQDNKTSEWYVIDKTKTQTGLYGKTKEEAIANATGGKSLGLPRAPFVAKTEGWLNLALKRVIKMAIDGGYDNVAFISGQQSEDRYDLSKQVDKITVGDWEGGYQVLARKDGEVVIDRMVSDAQELEAVVGKDIADKVVSNKQRTFTGLDLKIGGAGMRAFYDTIVPNTVNALLKKLGGGKVVDVGVNGVSRYPRSFASEQDAQAWANANLGDHDFSVRGLSESEGTFEIYDEYDHKILLGDSALTQPGFVITDAMREHAAGGLPLFSKLTVHGERQSTRTHSLQAQRDHLDGPGM